MKKKLLSFLLVMCLMLPAALYLTGCKKKDDKDNNPPPPTALEIFNTANTNLDTILDNATVTIVPNAQITAGVMKMYGGEDCAITMKTDNQKAEYFIPEELTGADDAKLIADGKGNYYTYVDDMWDIYATEGETAFSNIDKLSQLNVLIQEISDIAHFYQSSPLKLVTEENNKYLSLDLDLGARLNNALIVNYKTNHDKPAAAFINTLLSDLSQKNINIVELIDDFAIGMTNDTTALEFVEFMSDALGIDVDKMVDFFNGLIKYTNNINATDPDTTLLNMTMYADSAAAGIYNRVDALDKDMLDEIPMLEMIRFYAQDDSLQGADISQMVERMLADEDYAYTLDDIVMMMDDPDVDEFIYFMENTTINMLGLNVKINLDANNKPTKILFTLAGDGMFREDSSTYVPMEILATAECAISNVAATSVTLPRNLSSDTYYSFYIGLDQELFYWESTQTKFTLTVDSSFTPDSFTIVIEGVTIATFTKPTGRLQVDLIAIRNMIDNNPNVDFTSGDANVYEMMDSNDKYFISIYAV